MNTKPPRPTELLLFYWLKIEMVILVFRWIPIVLLVGIFVGSESCIIYPLLGHHIFSWWTWTSTFPCIVECVRDWNEGQLPANPSLCGSSNSIEPKSCKRAWYGLEQFKYAHADSQLFVESWLRSGMLLNFRNSPKLLHNYIMFHHYGPR